MIPYPLHGTPSAFHRAAVVNIFGWVEEMRLVKRQGGITKMPVLRIPPCACVCLSVCVRVTSFVPVGVDITN